MRFSPITAAAIVVGLTATAAAQMGPGMMGPGMMGPGFGAPQQQPPCFNEFMPLRQEAEKRAGAIQAAMKKKAAREEVCALIKQFSAAEGKVVNFVTKNQQQCGVPPQAVAQMAANHKKTLASQQQVCAVGAGPRPAGPGLSEALGVTRAPLTTDALAPKSGAMDTLTGPVLAR